ncbi:hypothetical protein [Saccharomonospora marina]|uniref:hypothetical protein n=1 Tax=Saccharomonospora marina TaxID=632569 RepID=UPI0002DEE166|nr:hypothetical protein [Saccharomonospora marina]
MADPVPEKPRIATAATLTTVTDFRIDVVNTDSSNSGSLSVACDFRARSVAAGNAKHERRASGEPESGRRYRCVLEREIVV